MKKIEAIIRASKFDQVKEALQSRGIHFFTFFDVNGYGHQKGESLQYRGAVYDQGYLSRIKLEIVVSEHFITPAVEAITETARTGKEGDGIIVITPVEEVFNIRTGQQNGDAINN